MEAQNSITVKISSNNKLIKTLCSSPDTNLNDYNSYLNSVKTIQKSTNDFLTELVDKNAQNGDHKDDLTENGEEDDEEDESFSGTKGVKRKFED